jgi:hypothetical protein
MAPAYPHLPVPDFPSSESENESDFVVDSEGESELGMAEMVESRESEDLGVPHDKVFRYEDGEDEV